MSLTSKQIDELRAYAKDRKGELAKLINDAADTIEILSAKLHASQMERSSQYYHGGWIPVSERLPEKPNMYTVTDSKGDVVRFVFYDTESSREYWLRCAKAWTPLPEPYREEGEEDD